MSYNLCGPHALSSMQNALRDALPAFTQYISHSYNFIIMDIDDACKRCSSFNHPVFHAVYPGPQYDFKPSTLLGVETRAQRKRREETERLGHEQLHGENFAQYSVTDIDNINCITFLTAWLFAIPTSPITNEADKCYFDLLTQRLIYRMNSLNASM